MTQQLTPRRPLSTGPARLVAIYGALIRVELQAASAYRAQLLLSALGWVVPVSFMALWRGAASGGPVDGISAGQFTTYFAVLLLTTSVQLTRHLSFEVAPMVHSGQLSALLLRPHHPLHVLIARGIAELTFRLTPLLLVMPLLILGIGGIVTHSAPQWVMGVVLMVLGLVAESYLAAMMGSLALWLTRSSGIRGLLYGAEWVFGGLVAPIALLPGILPELLRHQPLWFAIGGPAEAISGISVVSPWTLVEAAGWIVVLHLLFTEMWKRGMRRYEAVGT